MGQYGATIPWWNGGMERTWVIQPDSYAFRSQLHPIIEEC